MPYRDLYNLRQKQQSPSLDLQWFRDQAAELGWVNNLKMVRTDELDSSILCGLVLRRPNLSDHGITSDYIIITSGDLKTNPIKEKTVAMKELMHLYRPFPAEENASALGFDTFVRQFFGHSASERTNAVMSEYKALWMALGVVCPEYIRTRFLSEYEDGRPISEIAAEMEVQEYHAVTILSDQFTDEIQALLK